MAKYDEVIGNLSEVDDDTLNSAHGEAKARIAELRAKISEKSLSSEELAEIKELAPAVKTLHDEFARREADRAQVYAAAEEALSAIEDPETEGQEEHGGEEQATDLNQAPSQVEVPAEVPAEQEPQLVAASAGAPKRPAAPRMGEVSKAAPKAPVSRTPVSIVAAADVSGFAGGQSVQADDLGRMMANRLRSISHAGGNGEFVPVATILASGVPEERKLRSNDSVEHNTHKIHQVTSQRAITAAGGLCAPLEIDYSYGVWGTQGRPVKNALPNFQVDRGGLTYRKDIAPLINTSATVPNGGPAAATGFWSMTNDQTVADGTNTALRKNYWIVDCPSTVTAQVQAITFQIEFANITSRFDPETMQANLEAALIWHDRIAENDLLTQIKGLSKYMENTQVLGAVRELLVALDKLQAYYRSVHRLSDNVTLRAILPSWAKQLIRSDIARSMTTDGSFSNLAVSDAQIENFFTTRNVSPVWHLDGSTAAVVTSGTVDTAGYVPDIAKQQYSQTTGYSKVPAYPTEVEILLFPEGHFQHLDGGALDLGIVRDSDLVGRNRYRQFSETFEGVAARGVEALRLVLNVTPNGAMAGTVAPATTAGWQ